MVLIFIPQSAMTPFLKNFTCEVDNPETQNLIIPLINQCLEPSFDTAALNVLNFFCTRPFQSRPAADTSWSLPDEYTIKVLSMAIQTQNERFYEAICRHIIVNLSPLDYQWAIEIMWDTPLDFKLLQPPLERCVLALPNLAARYRMVVSLDRRGGHRAPRGLREVVRSLADRLVDSCYSEQLVTQDGEILVFIASAFWDFDWLVNRVGPLVRTRIKEVPFILGFICQLYTNDQEGRLHVNDSDVFLASLAWSLLVDLDVRSLISVKGFAQHYERHGMPQGPLDAHGRQTPSPPALTSQDTLLKFARAITSIDPPDSLTMLFVSVLVMQQDRIATDELIDLYIPFIRQLPKALDDCWTISGFPTWLYHKLLCSMVNSFWDRHDAQPRYDNLNWCCSFCTDLKFFLLHPTRQQDAFVATDEEQARHIESVLQVVQAHCSHKVLSRTKQHSRWEVSKLPDRAAEMKAQLQLFDQAELQAAFGVEYGRVTGTAPRTRVTGTAPRTVQPGTSAVSDASHPASTASVLQTHRAQGSLLLPRAPNDAEASQVSSTIRDQPVRSNAQTNSKGNDIEVVPRESQPAVIASRPLAESALASTTRLPLAPVGQNSSQTQPHESRDESSPVVGQKRKEGPDIDCKEARPSKM
ncbi:hypothetical protein GGR56DRAFT_387472 [Xylariaceae sp. FL0804]|nr:hypothetical protein GGR56DRAFT_387472 [Xylariaceae sp. FL0804]